MSRTLLIGILLMIVSGLLALNDSDTSKRTDFNLQIEHMPDGQIHLNWDDIAGAAGYDIYRSTHPAPTSGELPWELWETLPMATSEFSFYPTEAEYLNLGFFYVTVIPSSFIFVEGGTFNNGSSDVTVSSFYIDKYELTQAGYQAVMGYNPAYFSGNLNHPVEQVKWYAPIEYCNLRSIQEDLTPCYSYSSYGTNPDNWPLGWKSNSNNHLNISCNWTANGYRLPTEMEWMFAALGGNQTHNYTYSGSNDVNAVAWYSSNSESSTHPVGTKLPNELGLYDMSGNVWEWVWDISGEYPNVAQTNPHGATSGSYRVKRGGAWNSSHYESTVSVRTYNSVSTLGSEIGFRICRSGL